MSDNCNMSLAESMNDCFFNCLVDFEINIIFQNNNTMPFHIHISKKWQVCLAPVEIPSNASGNHIQAIKHTTVFSPSLAFDIST